VAAWIYFIHPPREHFIDTITGAEGETFGRHAGYLQRLFDEGTLVLAGPTLGTVNTGVTVVEAEDEAAARAIMQADPAIAEGVMTGELREMRVTFLRGRG
jgi:uncharacterized protein